MRVRNAGVPSGVGVGKPGKAGKPGALEEVKKGTGAGLSNRLAHLY